MSLVDTVAEHRAVRKALASLGDTETEVAESLRNLGIAGGHFGFDCPVALFLGRQGHRVSVGHNYTTVMHGNVRFTVEHPLAVARFIGRFDTGAFLDLHDCYSHDGTPTELVVVTDDAPVQELVLVGS